MNKRKPLLLLVALPILIVAAFSYFEDIDAEKSAVTPSSVIGSDLICVDRLCSEVSSDNEGMVITDDEENETMVNGYTYTQEFIPRQTLEIDLARTALFITDPQNDFISEGGAAWGLVG